MLNPFSFSLLFLVLTLQYIIVIKSFLSKYHDFHHQYQKQYQLNKQSKSTLCMYDIDIFTKDLDLTMPLKDRINNKIGKVINKLGNNNIITTNVILKKQRISSQSLKSSSLSNDVVYDDDDDTTSNDLYTDEETLLRQQYKQHELNNKKLSMKIFYICEITINLKNSYTIHINEKSDDLIKSIDIISHKLAKTLRRYHNKLIDNYQKGSSSSLDVIDSLPEFDEEELLIDLDNQTKQQIIKVALPGIVYSDVIINMTIIITITIINIHYFYYFY
jgi:ribosome-associated translation inhibitor RaiA